jgi:peptidyl-prolyl cis-trans isomerase C
MDVNRLKLYLLRAASLATAASVGATVSGGPAIQAGEGTSFSVESMPAVVARVNGRELGKDELLRRARAAREEQASLGIPQAGLSVDFLRWVLDQMIGTTLLYLDSEARGLAAATAEVEREYEAMRSGSPEAFDQELARESLDPRALKKELRENLSIQKLVEMEILPKLSVSETARRQFYRRNADRMKEPGRVRVRHILVEVDPDGTPAVTAERRKTAAAIRARLLAGEDFARLARENSDDPGSRPQGGELPWILPGETVPAFEQAAFMLNEPGQLSEVVESEYGFHIVQLLEKRPATSLSFDEASPQIDEVLREQELQDRIRKRVEELRRAARIEILI